MAVFDTDCSQCKTNDKIAFTFDQIITWYPGEQCTLFDSWSKELTNVQFFYDMANSKIQFSLPEYNRTTDLDLKIMGITTASKDFNSPFAGFVGIAPYTALKSDQYDRSFLH